MIDDNDDDKKLERNKSFLNGMSNQILLAIRQNKQKDALDCLRLIENFINKNTNGAGDE